MHGGKVMTFETNSDGLTQTRSHSIFPKLPSCGSGEGGVDAIKRSMQNWFNCFRRAVRVFDGGNCSASLGTKPQPLVRGGDAVSI